MLKVLAAYWKGFRNSSILNDTYLGHKGIFDFGNWIRCLERVWYRSINAVVEFRDISDFCGPLKILLSFSCARPSVIRFTNLCCVLSDGGAHFSHVVEKDTGGDLLAFQIGYSVAKRFGKGCCFLLIDSLMSRRPGWQLFWLRSAVIETPEVKKALQESALADSHHMCLIL